MARLCTETTRPYKSQMSTKPKMKAAPTVNEMVDVAAVSGALNSSTAGCGLRSNAALSQALFYGSEAIVKANVSGDQFDRGRE